MDDLTLDRNQSADSVEKTKIRIFAKEIPETLRHFFQTTADRGVTGLTCW
jgi:hypothetical protein